MGVIVLKRILHMGHVFAVFDQCIIQLPRVKGGIEKKKGYAVAHGDVLKAVDMGA